MDAIRSVLYCLYETCYKQTNHNTRIGKANFPFLVSVCFANTHFSRTFIVPTFVSVNWLHPKIGLFMCWLIVRCVANSHYFGLCIFHNIVCMCVCLSIFSFHFVCCYLACSRHCFWFCLSTIIISTSSLSISKYFSISLYSRLIVSPPSILHLLMLCRNFLSPVWVVSKTIHHCFFSSMFAINGYVPQKNLPTSNELHRKCLKCRNVLDVYGGHCTYNSPTEWHILS